MNDRRDRRSSLGFTNDYPPHSRIFIICPKSLGEDDFKKHFEEFGNIEEIFVVKDKIAGENKGVTYIQYSKTSEAAKAIEAMNGRNLGSGRSIKVMVAASREQGSKRESNEKETLQRLFVVIPKSMTDNDLYDYFKQFGDIDYANIIKDRNTKESKGFAYVKFTKFSHAAKAYENCDRKYKPVFAEPRKSREERLQVSSTTFEAPPKNGKTSFAGPALPRSENFDGSYNKLTVIGNPVLNQDQIWKLFDVVPTMDYCQIRYEGDRSRPSRCIAEVVYTSARWAAHAKEKLHGFEYPPGFRLIVKPEYENTGGVRASSLSGKRPASASLDKVPIKPDIMQIAETIAQATSLIEAAGLSTDILQSSFGINTNIDSGSYCNVKLPEPQPLASIDEETEARCFVVCTPAPLPGKVLKDIFCRFGNLIDVYMLNNRNCGYAKFASRQSAEDAIKTLHGAEVQGMRIKVMEAEERPDNRKRLKMDTSDDTL